VIIYLTVCCSTQAEKMPGKRKPFSLVLPHMSYSYDHLTKNIEIFVAYEGSQEGWGIASGSDRYVKDTKKIRMDNIYRELPSQTAFISTFEAGVIAEVCNRMAETVLIFEKDLKQEHWDRCLFLDAYFPNFMKRFYYLYCAACASFEVLPQVTKIEDTLFEVSEKSLKSDRRVAAWRSDTSHAVKLRIAAKELAFQLQAWRKDVLLSPERDFWDNKDHKLVEVYELFVRLYFNLPQKNSE
jgi:hypothetical protein